MGQLQKVSWRTAGYAALGTVLAAASVVAVVNSEGVRPTSLMSSAATRWLVDQVTGRVVLVDGLAGTVVAKIATDTEGTDEVAVQGAGGAFLVAKKQGSIRTISTAKLQLGTAQAVGLLLEPDVKFGVGASGLTVVSPDTNQASVIAVDDVTRPITVPPAERAFVAADGSMWLLSDTDATHVNIDQSTTSTPLRSDAAETTTVGARAVSYDDNTATVSWLDGGDVSLASIPNASQAVLQQPGDDASCVWLGVDDTLLCVGATGIDRTVVIDDMNISSSDQLAIAGNAAVIVTATNDIERIDLEGRRLAEDPAPTVRSDANLTITAAGDLIWIDDPAGQSAWVVHRFGINAINKNAKDAPLLDAQGQVQDAGTGDAGPAAGSGNTSNDTETSHLDPNPGQDDPPVAVDDSVTARAGSTIIIPVTGNDYDPDGDAIAVLDGNTRSPTYGVADVLNGTSITYRPNLDYSGSDSFEYTIVDENGGTDSATVSIELFPPGSPNRPPIARPDTVTTRINRAVTIDVLINDIDPERDLLSVPTFQNNNAATITDTIGPTGLPALEYLPPPDRAGTFKFTYQAADPQGGTSQKTTVTVEVSGDDADNEPPVARPDAVRLRVGVLGTVNVKANDTDPDGDDLEVTKAVAPNGVTALIAAQQLNITLLPGAPEFSVVTYTLSDGDPTHDRIGKVLVLRLGDTAPNRPPVANADAERVVIGNSVKIPVTANDLDPENDSIRLLTVQTPADDAGVTSVEGNSVRFVPNLPDITEPTPVTFKYRITDGHGNEAIGTVTVTVLVEALPRAPFARDDFADTVTNQPVNIDVLANDSDPSGGTPSLIGDPVCTGGGDAIRTSDDRVTFTPPTNATGTYRCIYTVSNTQGLRAEASIIVSVTEAPQGNRPPQLDTTKLQQTVNLGGQLTLTANQLATDADADSLVFASVAMISPGHGTTSFVPNGPSFTYFAPATAAADNAPVADTIDVIISDGNDGTVRGSVSIKIVDDSPPASAPPSTTEIPRSGEVGQPVSVDVVAELRDRNPGIELTLTSVSLDTGAGSAALANGVAVITATGEGVVTANYTVTNPAGVPASNKIRVNFSEPPPSNPPVAQPDALTIASGGSASVDLLANDTGIGDPGDIVTTALNTRPPASFASVDLVNGTLSVVAQPGASGVAVIRYTLSDGSGETSTATITLTVLQCSESPPSAVAAFIFTPYQTPINIDLTQYVTSGHIQPGSVSGAGLTGPTGTYSPPAQMNGSETVNYIVQNGCQQTFQGQLVIDVNRAPFGGSVTRNMSRGSTLALGVDELASDDEPLTITALHDNPSWVTIQPGGGSILAVPPTNAPSQEYRFTVTVQDPGGLTANASVNLIINNIPPTARPDTYETQNAQFSFSPLVNDFDSEPGPLCIQNIFVTDQPPRATVDSVSPGDCGTTVSVTLQHGVHHFNYDIRDGGQLVSTSTITITYNRPPTLAPASGSTNGQTIVQIPLDITEPDGDDVSVSCPAPPGFTTNVLPNPGQGPTQPRFDLIVGVPDDFNSNTNNSQAILCTVSDGFDTDSATMTVTVV